ncbi:MAG: nucleotidyltransferase family protein, partial [Candidatus Methylomirabilia bacterium]
MSGSGPTARIVRASGRSMFPLIPDGAEVGIVPVDGGSVSPGDIVAFRVGERTLVHRVIEARRDAQVLWLREKGDGNAVSTWITARDLEGRAVWVGFRGALRRLDPTASRFAVRLLTRGSRAEADLADALRAGLVAGGRVRGRAAAAAGVLLRPFKALALPLLAAAYPGFSLDDESAAAEREFLLACCRRELDPATPVAGSNLDGLLLLQGAVTHGVVPAVLRWSGAALPPGIAGELRRHTLRAGLAHLGALETFREAAAALDAAGVPHLVLKGLALVHLYPSGAERFSSDLDLLVAPADRARARRALLAAGYSAPEGVAARLLDRVHFHVTLVPRAKGRVPIELHWGLTDRAW